MPRLHYFHAMRNELVEELIIDPFRVVFQFVHLQNLSS
jgi:hypothetical protein